MSDDIEDRRAAQEQRKKLAQEQLESDTRWLMNDPRGRRLMWGWLADAGVFRLSWTGMASRTDFNEGQRNMGLKLHAQVMQHCPADFIAMLTEAQAASGAHKPKADS